MRFDDLIRIAESSIDLTRNHFSSKVFVDGESVKPTLSPDIRAQIQYHVSLFNNVVNVRDYFIKGSILTKQYGSRADIDIYIIIDEPESEQVQKRIEAMWKKLDGIDAHGTQYPLQYFISDSDYDFDNTEAAYNLKTNKWIKQSDPQDIKISNYKKELADILNRFDIESGELKRDILDYEYLVDIPESDLKGLKKMINGKLREINYDVSMLIKSYSEVKNARNDGFAKDMSESEIKTFGRKTHLPGNVIFKFLERYYYLQLVRNIRDIIGDDERVDQDEIEGIRDELIKKESFDDVSSKLTSTSARLPRTRQQSGFTGMSRKHQNLVPACHKVDPTSNQKVDILKDMEKGTKVLSWTDLKHVISKYNVGNLSKDKPRKLGNTGISIFWNHSLNNWVITK